MKVIFSFCNTKVIIFLVKKSGIFVRLKQLSIFRSNREVFHRKRVTENFANFTGKNLRWSLFFNNFANLKTCNVIKKRLQLRCFPVKFAKFLKATCFTEHLLEKKLDLFQKGKLFLDYMFVLFQKNDNLCHKFRLELRIYTFHSAKSNGRQKHGTNRKCFQMIRESRTK